MTTTFDIVAKLWSLCHVLRDDGVTYNEYVTELTFLLFLKMLEETRREDRLPKAYRWRELAKREGLDQLDYYKRLLLDLGKPEAKDALVQAIFTDAQTRLRKPTNLKALTSSIDQLDWFSAREEGLGNLYEGLLEKNAEDKKSGAGQYFTPRRLIDCVTRLMKPQAGEVVQDPAAGTGGFLVAADRYIKDQTDDLYKLSEQQGFFQRHNAFVGAELVPDTDAASNHDGKRIPVRASDRALRRGEFPYYGASGVIDTIDDYLFDGDFLLIGEDGANLISRSTPMLFAQAVVFG
jgi:type I restriction enzyme M protein